MEEEIKFENGAIIKLKGRSNYSSIKGIHTCCSQPMVFTSYNRELKPDAPEDHWTCLKCKKHIDPETGKEIEE